MASARPPLLEVEDLYVRFYTRDGVVRAVNGAGFHLRGGETLGLVGESGCGKSVISLSIMGLIPQPPGRIERGAIRLGGLDLLELTSAQMQRIRGNEIAMIFQEPMTSLNPVLTIGFQIAESLRLHQKLPNGEAWRQALKMLEMVRIPDAARRLKNYPHQLSGGMRQRVMIAMALSCRPKVLIADEPTTALDVTIQAQILTLMTQLKEKLGTAIIMITHDLGVISQMAQRVMVLYAGRPVEEAPVTELFLRPAHPYTRGLIASIPRVRTGSEKAGQDRLAEIPGQVPDMRLEIRGCAFAPRCRYVATRCEEQAPPARQIGPGHWAACWETDRVRMNDQS
ncbi:MAG: ABC transporter ATP-binding protein [Thermodesulfobacteriota bacterium]